jgi:hypothetical protein
MNQPRHAASATARPTRRSRSGREGARFGYSTVSRIGAPRRTQISRFLAAAGVALAALVIAVVTIRVRGEDLAGAAGRYQPEAGPAPSEHEGEAP